MVSPIGEKKKITKAACRQEILPFKLTLVVFRRPFIFGSNNKPLCFFNCTPPYCTREFFTLHHVIFLGQAPYEMNCFIRYVLLLVSYCFSPTREASNYDDIDNINRIILLFWISFSLLSIRMACEPRRCITLNSVIVIQVWVNSRFISLNYFDAFIDFEKWQSFSTPRVAWMRNLRKD